MNRYQLAKLVSWAQCLRTRKRLQKVVFLLKAAGCPLEADFYLHHYGPYSDEISQLTDDMVRNKMLVETSEPFRNGSRYSYCLTDWIVQQLGEVETTEEGQQWRSQLAPFEARARELLGADLKELEYASTIVFFHNQGFEWSEAVERAIQFKHNEAVRNALPLARRVVAA